MVQIVYSTSWLYHDYPWNFYKSKLNLKTNKKNTYENVPTHFLIYIFLRILQKRISKKRISKKIGCCSQPGREQLGHCTDPCGSVQFQPRLAGPSLCTVLKKNSVVKEARWPASQPISAWTCVSWTQIHIAKPDST